MQQPSCIIDQLIPVIYPSIFTHLGDTVLRWKSSIHPSHNSLLLCLRATSWWQKVKGDVLHKIDIQTSCLLSVDVKLGVQEHAKIPSPWLIPTQSLPNLTWTNDCRSSKMPTHCWSFNDGTEEFTGVSFCFWTFWPQPCVFFFLQTLCD